MRPAFPEGLFELVGGTKAVSLPDCREAGLKMLSGS